MCRWVRFCIFFNNSSDVMASQHDDIEECGWKRPCLVGGYRRWNLSGVSDGTFKCRQAGWPSSDRESNSRHSECKGEVRFQASAANSRGFQSSGMLR